MTTARFQPAGWMPGAILAALDRIEAAVFGKDPNTDMHAEVRDGLRAARDALTDADATYRAQVAALNRALDLHR